MFFMLIYIGMVFLPCRLYSQNIFKHKLFKAYYSCFPCQMKSNKEMKFNSPFEIKVVVNTKKSIQVFGDSKSPDEEKSFSIWKI